MSEAKEFNDSKEESRSIAGLLPLDSTGPCSEIHQALMEFLGVAVIDVYRKKAMDIMVGGLALRIIIAFVDYEKTGDVSAFKTALQRKNAELGVEDVQD